MDDMSACATDAMANVGSPMASMLQLNNDLDGTDFQTEMDKMTGGTFTRWSDQAYSYAEMDEMTGGTLTYLNPYRYAVDALRGTTGGSAKADSACAKYRINVRHLQVLRPLIV